MRFTTFLNYKFFYMFHHLQLCGGVFLAMGLWLHLSNQGYATLYPNHLGLSAESLLILIGSMSIVISFFGCCGSFFESRCCLIIVSRVRHLSTTVSLNFTTFIFFLVLLTHHYSVFEWIYRRCLSVRVSHRYLKGPYDGYQRWHCETLQLNRSWGNDIAISVSHLG